MEVLQYTNPAKKIEYTIHVAFPSNISTEGFFEEQKNKPQLAKEMEGSALSSAELEKKLPSAEKVARIILAGVEKGDFAVCDSFESGLLWANTIGPSPRRGLGIMDTLLALLVSMVIWPFQRRQWDSMCRKNRE